MPPGPAKATAIHAKQSTQALGPKAAIIPDESACGLGYTVADRTVHRKCLYNKAQYLTVDTDLLCSANFQIFKNVAEILKVNRNVEIDLKVTEIH